MPASRLILHEGAGDEAFFKYLIRQRNIPDLDVYHRVLGETGGETDFERLLRAHKPATGSEAHDLLVIAADNDGDPAKKFKSVVDQIKAAEDYAVPTKPREVVRNPPFPAVAVL